MGSRSHKMSLIASSSWTCYWFALPLKVLLVPEIMHLKFPKDKFQKSSSIHPRLISTGRLRSGREMVCRSWWVWAKGLIVMQSPLLLILFPMKSSSVWQKRHKTTGQEFWPEVGNTDEMLTDKGLSNPIDTAHVQKAKIIQTDGEAMAQQ